MRLKIAVSAVRFRPCPFFFVHSGYVSRGEPFANTMPKRNLILIAAIIGLGVGFGIPAVLIANLFFHFLPIQ